MCLTCGCKDTAPLHPMMPGIVGYNVWGVHANAPPQGDSYPTVHSTGFAIAAMLPDRYCYSEGPPQNAGNQLTKHQQRPHARYNTNNVPGQTQGGM